VPAFSVCLLAERPGLIDEVASLRWREWGHAAEPADFGFWLETTTMEAGGEALPVTFVALDGDGRAIGAVGLAESELPSQPRERSPWVVGMVVEPAVRRLGVGRGLMRRLEGWALARNFTEAWVATDEAADFYRACGWRETGSDRDEHGRPMTVLNKRLLGPVSDDPRVAPDRG
jgi:GNAT superfamily N-acetyltransferase